MKNENAFVEQKVESIMISKIQLVASFGVFLAIIIGFFFKIQLDVSLIKQNHETHMEMALTKIAELDAMDKTLQAADKELDKRLQAQNEVLIKLWQFLDDSK